MIQNNSIDTLSVKNKFTMYDFIISMLIISCIAFYDEKKIFLGTQMLALVMTFAEFGRVSIKGELVRYIVWVFGFVLFSYISMIWASKLNDTVLTVTASVLQVGLIGICILVYCTQRYRFERVINVIVLSGIILCLRFYVSVPSSQWGLRERLSKDTIFGSNNPAMALAYASVLVIWKRTRCETKKQKKIFTSYLYIIIFMFVSMMTGTKKGILIFAIGFVIISLSRADDLLSLIKRIVVIAIVIGLMYWLIINIDVLYNSIGYRIEAMVMGLQGGESDRSTEQRMNFLQDAFNVFKENPLIGVGQDGYRYVNSYEFTYSHSNYTEILANLGIIGFGLYYWFIAYIFGIAIKISKTNILPIVIIVIMCTIDISMISFERETTSIMLAIAYISALYTKNETITEGEKGIDKKSVGSNQKSG